RRADETPQARGGSSLDPRKATTCSETERTHHTTPPTQIKNMGMYGPLSIKHRVKRVIPFNPHHYRIVQ
ncbi:hypothetical protein, partial [Rossellomorea marisflavi]|uniref:hypothetical protein n=1 Tax=Rossellomorea marisflavi TaxID=189381 RepID=UPI003D2EAC3F